LRRRDSNRKRTTANVQSKRARLVKCNKIFIAYAREDATWLDKLKRHVQLELPGTQIETWDDSRIEPGDEWEKKIDQALARSRIGILLVSVHSLTSEFIQKRELPKLLDLNRIDGCRFVLVQVSPSTVASSGLDKYQGLNDPKKPLNSFHSTGQQDQALSDIGKKVKELAEELTRRWPTVAAHSLRRRRS
jgi:internalin A